MEQQPMIVSIIGPPGGGKSTFARNVISSPEYAGRSTHISIGDEVRKIYADTKKGESHSLVASDIKRHYESGNNLELLPDDIVRQVAEDALLRVNRARQELTLLDGLPRRISQIHDIHELTHKLDYTLGGVINVTTDHVTALLRMIGRGNRPGDIDPEPTVADAKKRQELYVANSLSVPLALLYDHTPVYNLDSSGSQDATLQLGLNGLAAMRKNPQPRQSEPA